MDGTEKRFPLRVLMLIATPKLADKAAKMFHDQAVPLLYRLHAVGTASSEMMDILGLGSIDKGLLAAVIPKCAADKMLRTLHRELRLGLPGSGIAFTLPLSGANALLFRMLCPMADQDLETAGRKEEPSMNNCKHMLIAAVVNQGYSEQVMDAARSAGAVGGSVLHSRHIAGGEAKEAATSFWGLHVQEEKEMILILADAESKLNIMKAISEACGMRSQAQGLVVSLPIDAALGLGELE